MSGVLPESHGDAVEVCYTPKKRSVIFDVLTGTFIGAGTGVATLLSLSGLYSLARGRKFYESLKKDISNDVPYILLSGGIGSIAGFIKAYMHNNKFKFEIKYSERIEKEKATKTSSPSASADRAA